MAFATGRDVMQVIERLIQRLWGKILDIELPTEFPHVTYQDAMAIYGSDKPDRRLGLEVALTS